MAQTVSAELVVGPPRGRRLQYALLALIVVLGAALRVYDLGAEDYGIDEVSMIEIAGADVQTILADFRHNGRPPVYVWLARGWMIAFGTSEVATRSLSALFGIAAILMMFVVGRAMFGHAIGLISAFLLALSTAQIQQAQSFRYYSLMVFLTLVSFFCYQRALRMGRARDFAAWAFTSVLLFYTHHFGVFALAAQTLHSPFALRRDRRLWAPWMLAQTAIYAPVAVQLLVPLADRLTQGAPPPGPAWIPPRTWVDVGMTYKRFLLDASKNSLIAACLALLAGSLAFGRARHGRAWLGRSLGQTAALIRGHRQGREVLLVVLWLLLPVVGPFVLSMLLKPMFVPRYTLGAAPALYLIVAYVIVRLRPLVPPALVLAVFSTVALNVLHNYYARPRDEQVREAAALVTSHARPGDAILMGRHDGRLLFAQEPREQLWAWYYRGNLPRCDRREAILDVEMLRTAVQRCLEQHERVWFVFLPAAFPREFAELLSNQSTQRELQRYWHIQEHHFHRAELYLLTPRTAPDPQPEQIGRVTMSPQFRAAPGKAQRDDVDPR